MFFTAQIQFSIHETKSNNIIFSLSFQYCNGGDLADYLNGEFLSADILGVIFPLSTVRNVTNPDPETEQRALNQSCLN